MKIDIQVPAMGESITDATIGTILKPTGTIVEADEEILELETDKVNQVLFAPKKGQITISVKSGDVVKIGQLIGYVDAEISSKEEVKKEPEVKAENRASETVKPESKPEIKPQVKTESVEKLKPQVRISINEGITDLIEKQQEIAPSHEMPKMLSKGAVKSEFKLERTESRKKLSRMRQVIAARLVQAQKQAAMLTTFNEVDMTQIMLLREKYKDTFTKEHGVKLGFMSFFVKAVVTALEAFPNVNSRIEADDIVTPNFYDIGIAVGTDKGLFVPVIRNCDHLTFSSVESALEEYAKKARSSTLTVDDLTGGSFTITNGGVYGSLLSTPILNLPQSAILGMHKIEKRAVVVDDQIVIRQMMYLALSYDHRIIDGKEAVSFLVMIKNMLEDPTRLLLEV